MWLALAGLVAVGVTWYLRPRHLPPPPLAPPGRIASHAGRAPERGPAAVPPSPADAGPRVAIVIDDLGDSLETARAVLALEPAVTVAVIPFRPASAAVAAEAVQRGREVILHLPLEPERDEEMAGAPGFLRTSMSATRMEEALDADLHAVPYIVGVNGHMGSRFTRDAAAMQALLAALRSRGLFFLDSRTTPESVARDVARRLGVPFAERAIFLDHDPSPAAVEHAVAELGPLARRSHEVVAIGHPHATTLAALAAWLPRAAREGVAIVPASALVR